MPPFWQFAHLSARYRGQNALDLIPSAGKLYLGGLRALDDPQIIQDAGITHILSVLDFDYCRSTQFNNYQRLWIDAEDFYEENLLRHFPTTNSFVEKALKDNGSVLVHCAMGVSRSATTVCAYLMHSQKISMVDALSKVQQSRPTCQPNSGFIEQLQVYEQMLKAGSKADSGRIYDRWLSQGSSKL